MDSSDSSTDVMSIPTDMAVMIDVSNVPQAACCISISDCGAKGRLRRCAVVHNLHVLARSQSLSAELQAIA